MPKYCQIMKNCSVSFFVASPGLMRFPLFAAQKINDNNDFEFIQIFVEHLDIWRPKHWNVVCGKKHPDIQKRLMCKYQRIFTSYMLRHWILCSWNVLFGFFKIRWACGVIMFTLLVGCPPFWHRKQMVMLRNIMEGKYSFTSPEWADISGKKYREIRIHKIGISINKTTLNNVLQRTQKISLESV